MKNKLKIILCLILCLSLSMIAVPVYAVETSPINKDPIIENSTLSFRGPLSGARKVGKAKKLSAHKNLTTAYLVIQFLISVSNVEASYYTAAAPLVQLLLDNCVHDQYYTRTLYYSSDGTMYYYKYSFYKNSNYTGYLGSDYSFVYSLLY